MRPSRYLLVGWVLPCEGGGCGPNDRYVPRKPRKPSFLAGCPGTLPGYPGGSLWPGYPGGARKVREKKFVFNFWPLITDRQKLCVNYFCCLFIADTDTDKLVCGVEFSCRSFQSVTRIIQKYHPKTKDGRRVQFSLVRNSELHCRGRCRFNSCPRPIRITCQMHIWCLAVSMLL